MSANAGAGGGTGATSTQLPVTTTSATTLSTPPTTTTLSNSAPGAAASTSASPSPSPSSYHIAGVPVDIGQPVHVTTKKQLQRQVNVIVGWNELDRAPMNIGSTLQRSSEPQLLEHSYFVCERAVGIRYLALLVQGRCYLIAPNYDMREVALFSPVRPDRLQPGMDRNAVVPHQWTLLDGLLVCDKDVNAAATNTKSVLTLLLYDILALNGSPVMASKLPDRLKLIQNDVIGPRKTVAMPKTHPPDAFQLVLQAMYPLHRVSHVIRTIMPRVALTRQSAGLVFTPTTMPYTPGFAKGLLFYAPASQLTAEFQLGVEWRGRPPKSGYKLVVHDKRTQVFHDWITFTPDELELFRLDKKASSRIVECVYDSEWLTFVPSHDKSSWDNGSSDFQATERGVGWRKGGWRFVRRRPDKSMPLERSYLLQIEKALVDDIHFDEFAQLFPDDGSKRVSLMAKSKDGVSLASAAGGSAGSDNKGVCQRGRFCHFSHCACNSTCSCTSVKNTYGQRPSYRRNDYDAPSSSTSSLAEALGASASSSSGNSNSHVDGSSSSSSTTVASSSAVSTGDKHHPHQHHHSHHHHPLHARGSDASFEREKGMKKGDQDDEEEAGELIDNGSAHISSIFAPLERLDSDAIAMKRAQLSALGNRRIWASLGLEDRPSSTSQRTARVCGLIVTKTGDVSYVRPVDK